MPKIMIVDDDITSLSMARAILESEYTTDSGSLGL